MNKVTFVNGQAPALNATNLNQMQTNVENEFKIKGAIESATEPTGENRLKFWYKTDAVNGNKIYILNNSNVYEEFDNSIVSSGSNANGTWVKYSDGRMICTKSVTISTTFSAWGVLYESSEINLGDFAQSFITKPTISATKTIGKGSWLELVNGTSATAAGKTYLVSATSGTSSGIVIDILAVGRWKS